jgi:NADH:ubiquinone oxidoreductase subunit 4 (subunit M)
MLTALLVIPIIGVISVLSISGNGPTAKLLALGSTLINLIISLIIWGTFDNNFHEFQFVQEWLQISFCHFHIGVDGISLFFVLLTTFISPITILTNWREKNNVKFNLIILLILESLLIGSFIMLDLILFYIFFESALIPLFILILKSGAVVDRDRAALLLFLYTLSNIWCALMHSCNQCKRTKLRGNPKALVIKDIRETLYPAKLIIMGMVISLEMHERKWVIADLNQTSFFIHIPRGVLILLKIIFYAFLCFWLSKSTDQICFMTTVVPIAVYTNADQEKLEILRENVSKSGVYRFYLTSSQNDATLDPFFISGFSDADLHL